MSVKLRAYSDYTTQMRALCGFSFSVNVSTEIAAAWEALWNDNLRKCWVWFQWLDVCPYGEARFVGNYLTYPNDLSKTANWTATALTITGDNFKNPLDGRTTASKLIETAASSAHSVAQSSVTISTSTTYNLTAYLRQNGRTWGYLKFNDGVNNYTAFFDVGTGATGTVSGTGATATIGQQPGGYYLCVLQFTTASTASGTGTATLQLSTDGSTLSYAGDTAKGLYAWGLQVQQVTNTTVQDSLVAFDQTGEERMEAVFEVWQDSPYNVTYPREQAYELRTDGIQIISGNWASYPTVNSAGVAINTPPSSPVFIYYRKQIPDFTGETYSASATYAVDDQIEFTDADSVTNFFKCIVATSAGESPSSAATKWSKLQIPDALFWPALRFAYADWLTSDGQGDKALGALAVAQSRLDDAVERESRQMDRQQPCTFQTHTSAQARYF